MLILESSGGRNVFEGGDPVTEPLYRAYLAERDRTGPLGVGPCQITWPPLQDRADELGGCWRPEINCRVGFELLADHIERYGPERAFAAYNSGAPEPNAYSARAMELLPTWRAIVSGDS
jgi:hypothetical protein